MRMLSYWPKKKDRQFGQHQNGQASRWNKNQIKTQIIKQEMEEFYMTRKNLIPGEVNNKTHKRGKK